MHLLYIFVLLKNIRLNLFYHIGLWLYRLIVRLISPFHAKAALFNEGHNGLIFKIKEQITHEKPIVWFHCASLGEFEQGRPIIEEYRRREPEHNIVVTFFSPSGYEPKKSISMAEWVFYLPLDTKRNVRRFLDTVQPVKAIFIKYEFWHNYLAALKKRKIPTYVVSAIFHPSQPFFKWYGAVFRRILRTFTLIFVQNQESKELLRQIDFTNVMVAGDTRFDRVWAQAQIPCTLPMVDAFLRTSHQTVCVAGSTWPQDEALLLQALHVFPSLKLILVPHEVDQHRITSILEHFSAFFPIPYSRLSQNEKVPEGSRVLVVDTIGLLSSLYRYGTMAYVGGGFGDGIHNILEAAVYGIPVIFGPRYQRFNEAKALIQAHGAHSIQTSRELNTQLGIWLAEPQICSEAGSVCRAYVENHTGATERILEQI